LRLVAAEPAQGVELALVLDSFGDDDLLPVKCRAKVTMVVTIASSRGSPSRLRTNERSTLSTSKGSHLR
jgi:hypothetical protein